MNFYGQVFSIQEELFRGSSYVISRGIQNSDQKPIIIKYLNSEIQEGNENLKLKNEFYIHSQRKLNFSIKAVDFIDDTFLILEDFKGISLSDFIKNRKLDVTDFLFIALAMTECLIEIHENNIIHKDIKPANFIINENTKELKLTDFGISTLFQKEYVSSSEIKLEGTIQYISPEQTGRTGKPIDYRTDLYSLGISFYEMLTGRLPFATNDINQILHFHLAQIPDSPKKYNPDIPTILAALIQKLISKDPIARYQSANGLKFDLIEIQSLFEKNEEILSSMPFQLGANDFSDKFIISEKLYGREKEIQILQESFLDTLSIHQSNRFLLITGYSGIGKSSLISELNIPIQEKKGFLISGKFEQYQRNIPFFAISQSFADFIKQLLSREKSEIGIWKRDIQTAVGSIGKVITDVIPELELLIGVQEDVPEVSTEQGMNRFSYAFLQFVKACAKLEHPIVLFLDDLQWADSGSLFLLEQLLYEPDLYYILIIGAYRNNEVNSSSSFHFFLSNLEKENYQFKTIHLGNLEKKAIRDLLVDTLHSKSESIEELSDLIYSKTGGNPFFTKQFLFNLQDESF
ncbi:MAG TPA: AAA family ATPase, partial [Leptospiraceae bacterium]|nr:AAA family ATPase [Leptospiraceae bacterium]